MKIKNSEIRPHDVLSKYLRDIEQIPMLSTREEKKIAKRVKKGDRQAAVKLVNANLKFDVSAKEKELVEGFEAGKQKLMALESQKSPTQQSFGFSPRQQAEVEKLKTEQQRINRELKEVRKSLRADVETLGAVLKSVNIFMMPLFVTLAGIGYGIYRQRKMKRK